MKKNLTKKITLSILAGAMLLSSSIGWAAKAVVQEGTVDSSKWTGIVVNSLGDSSGTSSSASSGGYGAIAIGDGALTQAWYSTAVGTGAKSENTQASAFGYQSSASKSYSTALGSGAKAQYENSVALGAGSTTYEANTVSIGVNGGERRLVNLADGVNATDAVTVGQLNKAIANVQTGSVDLSGYYTKTEANGLLEGKANAADVYTKTEANGLLEGKANAADVYTKADADANFATQQSLTEGLDGKADKTALETEATTRAEKDDELLAMINKVNGGASDAIAGINQRLDKTNAKINKVGAGAAALAALHPLEYDPDDKLTFSAGMGNYAGENAAALGAFYRPNEKFMVSLGGTMGNGENMVNLGLSIGLDKPNGYAKLSKRELIQEVNAVKAENNMLIQKVDAVEAENEAIKAEMAEMKAMLQAIMAKK